MNDVFHYNIKFLFLMLMRVNTVAFGLTFSQ